MFFVKPLLLKFIRFPIRSDWNPIKSLTVLCTLIKFTWLVLRSWLLWIGLCILVGLCLMQQPCSPLLTYFLIYLYKSLLCLESYVQTSLFCACFSFLNSSCNSFIFGLYLSLLLIYEFDQFFDGLFPYLLYLLVRLSERSFPCMFGLLLWSVFLVFQLSGY